MPVIDAHHHYWWHARRAHEWPERAGNAMVRDFTPADLEPEMRQAGVDGTILVQTVNESGETDELLDLAERTPSILGVVGWLPLDAPDRTAAALARMSGRAKLVGFRHLMRVEKSPDWLIAPQVVAALRHVANAGLVFETVPLDAVQFGQVLVLAEQVPELRLVVDHMGRPPVAERGWSPWAELIDRAAAHSNVSIKLSAGFDLSLKWKWSVPELRRYVEHIVARFGAGRAMAGSNWPVVLYSATYQEVWAGLRQMIGPLSADDRARLLGGTAQAVYRLPR